MSALLVCPRGHRWSPPPGEDAPALAACPVCGLVVDPRPTEPGNTVAYSPPPQPEPTQPPADGGLPKTIRPSVTVAVAEEVAEAVRRGTPEGLAIPGHDILGELGRGGMGVVYKARQTSLNRLVALKMILAGARAGAQELARFRAEAEAVASLQHANIVQIYEVGEKDGCPYFALEYVDGGSLAQKLHGAPQPPRLAAHLVMTLARAVHYAHQRGIVHRDLKPVNILLATVPDQASGPDSLHAEAQAAARFYGIPKITDFGLAKHLGSDLVQTQTGSIMGTPSYMAPEQAEGHVHQICPATDVYALGVLLYEMLTGRPPFRGASPLETIQHLLSHEPLPPSRLQPKVPRDLETICLKCLQKESGKRYPSAEALAEDLARFLEGAPIRARPVGWWGRAVKWARRRPAWAALIAVSVLSALALVGGGAHYHVRLRQALVAVQQEREEARQNLVRMHVAEGTDRMDGGDHFGALSWFTEALRLDRGFPEREAMHRLRIGSVLRQCPRLAQLWVQDDAVNFAEFSPDGASVVTAGDDGTARVYDLASGRLKLRLEQAGPVERAVFSPDGRRLAACCREGTARVWDAASGRPVSPPLQHGGPLTWVAFSPDGRWLVTAGADEAARVWEAEGGKPVASLKHAGVVHHAAFSPDGQRVVTAGADAAARVWDARTWEPLPFHLDHLRDVTWAAFSPDGKRVVTASTDHTARVWDAATGRPAGPPLRHDRAVTRAAFSPDGGRVLTAGEDHTARIWLASTGELLVEPLKHRSMVLHAAFSPDGCRVATAGDDNRARVWNALTGAPLTPPLRHNGTTNHVAFSPDGRHVLSAGEDGLVRVWDIALGRQWSVPDSPPAGRRHPPLPVEIGVRSASRAGAEPGTEAGKGVLAASADGRRVVRREGERSARVHDAHTGAALGPPLRHKGTITHAAFCPDGRRVVTASMDRTARVWDARTGQEVSPPLAHASGVRWADFSPHGRRVVTASDDNTARVWDAASGELLLPPLKHNGSVLSASFSADGRRVATAGEDQAARVWDAATGEPLTPPLPHPRAVRRAVFSADGGRVLTTTSDGAVREWDLVSDDRPVEDLLLLAQLLTGTRIDDRRGAMPVTPPQLHTTWEDLRGRYPGAFTSSPAEVLAWHGGCAEECLRAGRWRAAAWHLDRLIGTGTRDGLSYARRGLAAAELGRWKEAAADFARAAERTPGEPQITCLHGLLCLQVGDREGYRRVCRAALKREPGGEDAHGAFLAAWVCLLAPDGVADPLAPVRLAERAASRAPRNPDYAAALGTALYRANQLESAVRRLNEAMALRGPGPAPQEWLVLAMARRRLGQGVEAKSWLARAARWLAGPESASLPWHRRLQLELLRREADQLLNPPKSGS